MIRRNFITSFLGGLAAMFVTRPAKAAEQEFREMLAPQLQDPDIKVKVNPEPMTPATNENRYTDVRVMLDEIAQHTRRTGDIILRADDPRQRLIGFCSVSSSEPSVWFNIGATDAKNSLTRWLAEPVAEHEITLDAQRAQLVARYFWTDEGRNILCRAFPGQRFPA